MQKDIHALIHSYPRVRPPLTSAHEAVYVQEYKINRGDTGLLYKMVSRLETWGHRRIALCDLQGDILEIGSGSLNHIRYEPRFAQYDCIEPFEELYSESPYLDRVRSMYQDIDEIDRERTYARILSVAVLEHLDDLPNVVAKSALLLRSGGIFQAVIPTEGGFLWGASWRLTTGVAYRLRTGLDYKTLMRHEHVNGSKEILAIIRYFFGSVKISRFPLSGYHTSFYTYVEASQPDTNLAIKYVDSRRQNP